MEPESSHTLRGNGKEYHKQSPEAPGGKGWLAWVIVSILVTSLLMLALHQPWFVTAAITYGYYEIARILRRLMDGWNRRSGFTLSCFEVAGLVLVGLYHVEGGLIDIALIFTAWLIARLEEKNQIAAGGKDLRDTTPDAAFHVPEVPMQRAPDSDTAAAEEDRGDAPPQMTLDVPDNSAPPNNTSPLIFAAAVFLVELADESVKRFKNKRGGGS
ncbi:hypothetical protein ACFW6K_04940 [Streptomyces sp. NPDC058733]|uniref:hypothetical protein n=1 Tax=Streptomyces sp. NPDC058733 TaxID=3346614 RepID=UPI0036BAE2F0